MTSVWKSTLIDQLKEQNQRWHAFEHIIEHCKSIAIDRLAQRDCSSDRLDNRVLENNAILQVQCNKLTTDVQHLRLANAGLEKASEARFADMLRADRLLNWSI